MDAPPIQLPFGREWIVTMCITFTDSSVLAVDEQFRGLVARNFTSACNCFSLCVKQTCVFLVTFSLYAPLTVYRNYMLIFAH